MQTQVSCPQCRQPVAADVYQLIDVGQVPQMKQALIQGQLNMAQCQSCGTVFQVGTPLVYHDPAHELFMVHVPMELNMSMVDQEQLVGRMARSVMEATPQEQRKAYMLQPETIITMKSFMEKVLATEGITPEMIEKQNKQMELLQKLIQTSHNDVRDSLLADNASLIDDQFIALVVQMGQSADQAQQEDAYIRIINLQSKLMRETEPGKAYQRQQVAMHRFQQDVKANEGLSPELMLKHVLANEEDRQTLGGIVQTAAPALNYEFFALMTAEIEKRIADKDETGVTRLEELREDMLQLYEGMQQATQEMVATVNEAIDELLNAPNMEEAVVQNIDQLDESFLQIMEARMYKAEEDGNEAEVAKLTQLNDIIAGLASQSMPPEIQLMNELVMAQSAQDAEQMIADNAAMITPEFMSMFDMLSQQSASRGDAHLVERLGQIRVMLETAVK